MGINLPARRPRGLPLALAIDGAVFLALIVLYLWLRHATAAWPHPFHFPSGLMTIAMIMFGAASSFVMVVAVRSADAGDLNMAQRMVALAVVGWFTFLFLLAFEWARLYLSEQVSLSGNPWHVAALGPVYYGLTAFQAAHVFAGLAWMVSVAPAPRTAQLIPLTRFVHFTNAMFLILAFFVILASADLGGF